MIVDPTLARGGTLEIMITDVPDLVRVAVGAPVGNSDHPSLSAVNFDGSGGPKLGR